MSNYRDDTTDTAIARDATWAGLAAIADNTARIKELFVLAIAALSINSAVASDEISSRAVFYVEDVAAVSDAAIHRLTAKNNASSIAFGADRLVYKQRTIASDTAFLGDAWLTNSFSLTINKAIAQDSATSLRRHSSLLADAAVIKDSMPALTKDLSNEQAKALDKTFGKKYHSYTLADEFTALDAVFDDINRRTSTTVSDSAFIVDSITLTKVRNTLVEQALAIDETSIAIRPKVTEISADVAKAADELSLCAITVVSFDEALVSDSVTSAAGAIVSNKARATDEFVCQKMSSVWLNDTVKPSDDHWLKFSSLTSSASLLSDYTPSRLRARIQAIDLAAATDSINLVQISVLSDKASASDTLSYRKVASVWFDDIVKPKDTHWLIFAASTDDSFLAQDTVARKLRARLLATDTAKSSDSVKLNQIALLTEKVAVSDATTAKRIVAKTSTDTAKANERWIVVDTQWLSDTAVTADTQLSIAIKRSVAADTATALDFIQFGRGSKTVVLNDKALLGDFVVGTLRGFTTVADIAVITDESILPKLDGFSAWTSNTETWAMSRYEGLPVNRLTVINGVVYGESDDGVYRMDISDEIVSANVTTGKIDFGDSLVHPSAAYLEYETDGNINMQVVTTQSGQAANYQYLLPKETARNLTNGRILFGRGLRGRHFTFVLNISAKEGYINNLSIEALPTKRRV